MNNNLTCQLKQFHERILSQRGVTITYRQRGIAIADIPAVPVRTKFLNEKSGGHRAKFVKREYIVEFGLLTWDGQQIIPKVGDHIIEGSIVYEVTESESGQCYRPIDSTELYVRIFVQKTAKTI